MDLSTNVHLDVICGKGQEGSAVCKDVFGCESGDYYHICSSLVERKPGSSALMTAVRVYQGRDTSHHCLRWSQIWCTKNAVWVLKSFHNFFDVVLADFIIFIYLKWKYESGVMYFFFVYESFERSHFPAVLHLTFKECCFLSVIGV